MRFSIIVAAVAVVFNLQSCSSLSYYQQAAVGHLEIIYAAEPVASLLQKGDIDPELRQRLELSQRVRDFASQQLALPDNGSYRHYADLKRRYAVWTVVATSEFSLQPESHCFLMIGCFSYRGFYRDEDVGRYAERLKGEGFDVRIGGAIAYSTLGWFDDPILNTFVNGSEAKLVETMVHELAHQQLYFSGDSDFNEAFATVVAREGVREWFKESQNDKGWQEYLQDLQRRSDFNQLMLKGRGELLELYKQSLDEVKMRRNKAQFFSQLKLEYQRLKREQWQGYQGYDATMQQDLNNAHLAMLATYHRLTDAFQRLFNKAGRDFSRFYTLVAKLDDFSAAERESFLMEGGYWE